MRVCKRYPNGQSRSIPSATAFQPGRARARRWSEISARFHYPERPKRDPRLNVRHALFLVPEHVKLSRMLAR